MSHWSLLTFWKKNIYSKNIAKPYSLFSMYFTVLLYNTDRGGSI